MKRLIKKSEFYDGLQFKGYFEVYKNPTVTDINNLKKENNDTFCYMRGIISDDGNMYIWLGNLLHDKVINNLGITDGIHFDIERDFSLEVRIPNIHLDQFISKISPFKTYFNNAGVTNSSIIYISCNEYCTSLNNSFDKIKTMADIWNNK
jgi:hypothetical protein